MKLCPKCNYANNQASETCSECDFVFSPDTDVISAQSQEVLSECPFCGHTTEESLDTCPRCNKSLQIPWYDDLLIKMFMWILAYSKKVPNMSHGTAVLARDSFRFFVFVYCGIVLILLMNPPLLFWLGIGFGVGPAIIYALYPLHIKKKYPAIFDEEFLEKQMVHIYGENQRKD